LASDDEIPATCGTVVTVQQEAFLEAVKGPVESIFKTFGQEGLYIARTLLRAEWKVPARIINIRNRE
jgi:hypothetical protein